jgi:hypothetical protein
MSTPVAIQREWEGEAVAIFASGPSMNAAAAERCRALGLRSIAINNQAIDCAPWADVIYGSDLKWWRHYMPQAAALPGRKISLHIGQPISGVDCLWPSSHVFDERPSYLSTGGNSGYAALCLAAKLGATRVLLYGYDMGLRSGRMRRHEYPANLNSRPRFAHWIPRFNSLAPYLKGRGVAVVNCTPGSALSCFPFEDAASASSFRRSATC